LSGESGKRRTASPPPHQLPQAKIFTFGPGVVSKTKQTEARPAPLVKYDASERRRGYASRNLLGQRFGRLTVLARAPKPQGRTLAYWLCRCECGNKKVLTGSALVRGNNVSCGCYRRERAVQMRLRHGRSQSPEYNSYSNAKSRCTNSRHRDFGRYGARGIKFLYGSFEEFLADVGVRPAKGHVDRSRRQ
jgi:hypothetical protein